MMKVNSKFVCDYKTKAGYLIDNYALRAQAYRQAIKTVPDDTKLNKMGRIVEFIELLNDAEKVVDGFPMAMGNLGIKHQTLANCMQMNRIIFINLSFY